MLFLSRTKKLIFTPYIFITDKDLRLRTLTNNFWLFDNKFLGTWKVIKNCCKFLLHFSGKCASDYMHFRWNSNWEKALALNSFEFNFMKIAYRRIFHFFFFFWHQICLWNVNVLFTWNSHEAQFSGRSLNLKHILFQNELHQWKQKKYYAKWQKCYVFLVKIDPTSDGDTSLDQSADLSLDLSLDQSELLKTGQVFLRQDLPS